MAVEDGTDFRQSKVENLRVTAHGDEDVRGLDVAMDDPRGVGGIQCIGDFDGQRKKGFDFQRTTQDVGASE